IYVVADKAGSVFENGETGNNLAAADHDVDVTAKPYADLKVVAIEAAASAVSGDMLQLSWTVRNDGIGLTDRTEWADEVVLSRDPAGNDVILRERFTHI